MMSLIYKTLLLNHSKSIRYKSLIANTADIFYFDVTDIRNKNV